MSGTKILWGQILTVFLIVILTTWGATQYVAWRLAYQPELGPPWFTVAGFPVYIPPAFFWWWYWFDALMSVVNILAARDQPFRGTAGRRWTRMGGGGT